MVLLSGNSIGNGQAGSQSTGDSPGIVPIDTTIKSRIPRPVSADAPVLPPIVKMPSRLPVVNIPAAGRPMSLEQSLSTTTDPNDPKYKMSIGGKIMGTLANFLSGVSGQGSAVYTGKGAVNSRYYRDEENRLRQLNDARAQNDIWRRQQQDYWGQKSAAAPRATPSTNGSSPRTENITMNPEEYNY